jgi:hypothetical protein
VHRQEGVVDLRNKAGVDDQVVFELQRLGDCLDAVLFGAVVVAGRQELTAARGRLREGMPR